MLFKKKKINCITCSKCDVNVVTEKAMCQVDGREFKAKSRKRFVKKCDEYVPLRKNLCPCCKHSSLVEETVGGHVRVVERCSLYNKVRVQGPNENIVKDCQKAKEFDKNREETPKAAEEHVCIKCTYFRYIDGLPMCVNNDKNKGGMCWLGSSGSRCELRKRECEWFEDKTQIPHKYADIGINTTIGAGTATTLACQDNQCHTCATLNIDSGGVVDLYGTQSLNQRINNLEKEVKRWRWKDMPDGTQRLTDERRWYDKTHNNDKD